MKKLLTLAAVVAMVGASQAVSLSWNLTNIKQSGDSSSNAANYLVMLFITEQKTDNAGASATVTTASDIEDLINAGTAIDTKYIAASKTTTGGAVMGTTGYGGNNWKADETVSAFAVIFDASTQAAAENYFITDVKSVKMPGNGTGVLPFGVQSAAVYKPLGGTQPDIPEPATGALALAGVALLFRRRR